MTINVLVSYNEIQDYHLIMNDTHVQNESFLTDDLPQNHDIAHDIAHT